MWTGIHNRNEWGQTKRRSSGVYLGGFVNSFMGGGLTTVPARATARIVWQFLQCRTQGAVTTCAVPPLSRKDHSSPFEDLCIRARRETLLACSVTPGPPRP